MEFKQLLKDKHMRKIKSKILINNAFNSSINKSCLLSCKIINGDISVGDLIFIDNILSMGVLSVETPLPENKQNIIVSVDKVALEGYDISSLYGNTYEVE